MHRAKLICVLVFALGGCGGEYILTAPDHIAPVGREAVVVVRLQRSEVYKLARSVKNALLQFRIASGPERAAYTDDLGYAGTTVAVPARTGRYRMAITHQDNEGDIITGEAAIYAWDAPKPVVAVDLDCLPAHGSRDTEAAWSALIRIGARANILYLTRRCASEHQRIHEEMKMAGYPDGPVLLWQRERWHIRRCGRYRMPKVIVESRLVSRLVEIRKIFPGLKVGVCTSALAAGAFADAGMEPLVVGRTEVGVTNVTRRKSWVDLAAAGI